MFKVFVLNADNSIQRTIDDVRIHLDDTIQTVRNKITKAIGINDVSYKELHLFAYFDERIELMKRFNEIDEPTLSGEQFLHFISNYRIETPVDTSKTTYPYEYLQEVLLDNPATKRTLGRRYETKENPLFSVNPFQCTHLFGGPSLQYDETSVLLDYGVLHKREIFVCLAGNVLQYAIDNQLGEEKMCAEYFPYLTNIKTLSALNATKQELIAESKHHMPDELWSFYDTVSMFYDIPTAEQLAYTNNGIVKFVIGIKTDFTNLFPVDSIMKSIHASAVVPFIKYNPGMRRENVFRLYSNKTSTTGKRVPLLSSSEILKLSRDTGKTGEISMVSTVVFNGVGITLYMDFQNNGSLRVSVLSLPKPMTLDEISELLRQGLNPVIDTLNAYVGPIGYSLVRFGSLNDPSVEIMNLEYNAELAVKKAFDLTEYRNFLSSVFILENPDLVSDTGAKLRFKRVNHFHSMSAIDEFISVERFHQHSEIPDIINSLVKVFQLSEEVARNTVIQFITDNPSITANPGFPVVLHLKGKTLTIQVSKMTNIAYVSLVPMYIDSLLRLFMGQKAMGIPLKRIPKREHNIEAVEKRVIEPPLRRKEATVFDAEFFPTAAAEVEEPVLEEVFGMDFEDDELMYGGGSDSDKSDSSDSSDAEDEVVEGMKLKNPNPFQKRIEQREPDIFKDQSSQYSRTCSHAHQRQPVIIGEQERNRIVASDKAKGKFNDWRELLTNAIDNKATADESIRDHLPLLSSPEIPMAKPQFELIVKRLLVKKKAQGNIDELVQRIWSHLEPMKGSYLHSVSAQSSNEKRYWYICPRYWSLKENRSLMKEEVDEILKTEPKALIPPKADVVPKGAFIYEFAHPLEHFNERGEYIPHYPGFIKNAKAKYDFPCCFKRDQATERTDKSENPKLQYIAETNKFPVQLGRWGFLPQVAQDFFQVDNHKCVSKSDPNVIESSKPCLLRYGVEHSPDQSILACFADIYAYVNAYSEKRMAVPTIAEMRAIITKSITLDEFMGYHNSSLSSIFRPDNYVLTGNKQYNSPFIDDLDETNSYEFRLKTSVIGAYENFLRFLNDENAQIDHTYLWDIMTKANPDFFPDHPAGINLVILEIVQGRIELVCPTNSFADNLFDAKGRVSFILLKQDQYYEPVYIYEEIGGVLKAKKLFHPSMSFAGIPMSAILAKIESMTNTVCKPKNSLPTEYKYQRGLNAKELISVLHDSGFAVKSSDQVLNYQSKVIGINVRMSSNASVFVPCRPSPTIDDMGFTFADDTTIWNDYALSKRLLTAVFEKTGNKVKCVPTRKVVKGLSVIGFLTANNLFIRISPSIPIAKSDELDKDVRLLPIMAGDFIETDKNATTNMPPDKKRIDEISRIIDESAYYTRFRSVVRTLLAMYENRLNKMNIANLITNTFYQYNEKLAKIEAILVEMTQGEMEFVENPNTDNQFPLKNRITGKDNTRIYFGKIADELVRHRRIRAFLLEPKYYLNLNNVNYQINDDEILLLDSSVSSAYLNNLNVFDVNTYVKNISYDIAIPDKAQHYSNKMV
jgi:hypothetical protein